jgi:hypothetical protein
MVSLGRVELFGFHVKNCEAIVEQEVFHAGLIVPPDPQLLSLLSWQFKLHLTKNFQSILCLEALRL